MTGLHALHMIIGVGLFLYLTYARGRAYTGRVILRHSKMADCIGTSSTSCGFICFRCCI